MSCMNLVNRCKVLLLEKWYGLMFPEGDLHYWLCHAHDLLTRVAGLLFLKISNPILYPLKCVTRVRVLYNTSWSDLKPNPGVFDIMRTNIILSLQTLTLILTSKLTLPLTLTLTLTLTPWLMSEKANAKSLGPAKGDLAKGYNNRCYRSF